MNNMSGSKVHKKEIYLLCIESEFQCVRGIKSVATVRSVYVCVCVCVCVSVCVCVCERER